MEGRVHFCPTDLGLYTSEAEVCLECGGRLIVDRRGEVIGDGWALDHLIGVGGMRSSVWEAVRDDGRVAAIKIAEGDGDTAEARRLVHSASLVHELEHPAIARVFGYGDTDQGEAYVVMELLRGRTLLHLLQHRGTVLLPQAVHVVREILGALGYLHERGLVHRDVKPGNVHLSPRGSEPWEVKLIDFGIARPLTEGAPDRLDLVTESPGAWGRIVGTPEYMAPEQVLGAAIDGRADLYGAGVMLYRLVTGELPFSSHDRQAIYEEQLRKPPPVPMAAEGMAPLTPTMAETLLRALGKQPGERFQSAREFIAALDRG